MYRVTKDGGVIKILCPHRWVHKREWVKHKHSFNKGWFLKAFKLLNIELVETNIWWRTLPHEYLPWVKLPLTFQVVGEVHKFESKLQWF